MNSKEIKGTWNEHKGKLIEKIAALTDNDALFTDDTKDEIFGNLEIKLSKSKEELRQIIDPLKSM
ncbi:MAG: general stress protein CsbD [Paludibacter sp.]|nr:general stress protein CsbD [Paludibacter sp.]